MSKYWFGFKALPDGKPVACGPYRCADEANEHREKMKAPDATVSTWFVADSAQEAAKKAAFFMPN